MAAEGTNRAIVKNTLILYVRSFIMMAIGIFTSRIILQFVGVENFGLYGVVGSIISMFTILNGVLSAGSSRFLTFELGRKDAEKLKKTFSASFAMHFAMAIVLLVAFETVGLWFVNHKISIPFLSHVGMAFVLNLRSSGLVGYMLNIVFSCCGCYLLWFLSKRIIPAGAPLFGILSFIGANSLLLYKNSRPVEIGDHVWLCEGCTIMPGVRIGAGSVVGAKAVVFEDVPANSLVVGNPAKVVQDNVQWRY